MSMTEPNTPEPAKPHQKRGNKRKKIAKASDPEFAGLTAKNCCTACNTNRCVISGVAVCAHPLKGGIQAAQKQDPKVLARFARAKATLE